MTEPRNIRETNIARRGLEDRVALLQKWLWGLAGLLGTVLAAAAAIFYQLSDLKTDVAVVKTNVGNVSDRLARIEKTVDEIRPEIGQIRMETGQILSRVSRAEPPPAPRPQQPDPVIAGFYVTDGEAKLLRELLGVPQKTDARATIGLWQRAPESLLKPIPDDVAGKLPKLKGLLYAIDPSNNAIALTEPSGVVIATI
jgi:hypothetical protein